MRLVFGAFGAVLLLSGCLVDSMEKITKETRDEVRETKEGAQISVALENCINPEISESARVAACKPALLKLPEDRLADYLGIPMRVLREDSVKRLFTPSEIDASVDLDLPNVLYVGEKSDRNFELELAPTSEDFFHVLHMSVIQGISDISLKAMQPGLTAQEMDTYRGYGRRLALVATAVLGAVPIKTLNQGLKKLVSQVSAQRMGILAFQNQALDLTETLPKRLSRKALATQANRLTTLGKNLSFTEAELGQLQRLVELRMGISPGAQ